MARRKLLRKKEGERNLPVMKMTPRNSVLIVRKIMGPTGHTTQWTGGWGKDNEIPLTQRI